MKKLLPKILLILTILGAVILFFHYDLNQYLSFKFLKSNLENLTGYYVRNPFITVLSYFAIYISATALSLPGATILTLAGGAIFGLPLGLLIVSFASTIGATLAFLTSRYILQESIQRKFSDRLKGFNEGIDKEGGFYLFTLRLVPAVPFFVINLVMGITNINVLKFFFVSQIGMLAGTAVYVNAGVQLAALESLGDILSPRLIISFVLLGIFPLIAKKIIEKVKADKVYSPYKKPKEFDYNMIVIGAGSAGLVTAYICSAVNSKVALIEKNLMGGDCLNTGCVPSKALIKSANFVHEVNTSEKYGIKSSTVEFNFNDIMERVKKVISMIHPHDSIERYTKLGVDCIEGAAMLKSPWEIEVNGKTITAKNITIATGASPFVPPLPGIEEVKYLTSENLWELKQLPKNFLILGAGPIGMEMAQAFNRLGSKVTVVEMNSRIMQNEDPDISELLTGHLNNEGVVILTSHKAEVFEGPNTLIARDLRKNQEVKIEFDQVLIAIGRKANTKGFGLENLGITLRENSTIEANDFLQTNFPNIFVCGDVTGPYQLTHTAAHQAWFCAVNGLFGRFKKFKVDYSVIPWVTYTSPEVATVGRNEQALKREGLEYEVTKYKIDDLDRAIADSSDYGVVKVLTAKGSDKILGATIVAEKASDMLTEFTSAMKHKKGLNSILGTIHPYPTMSEANKYAAGTWKRSHKPELILKYLRIFHRWERNGTPESENSLNKIDA